MARSARNRTKSKSRQKSMPRSHSVKVSLLNQIKREGTIQPLLDLEWEEQEMYRRNSDFILKLFKLFDTHEVASYCMDESFTHDKRFLLLALHDAPHIMRYASYELFLDAAFIRKARRINPQSLLDMPRNTFVRFPELAPTNIAAHARTSVLTRAQPVMTNQNMYNVAGLPVARTYLVPPPGITNAEAVPYKPGNWVPGNVVMPTSPLRQLNRGVFY
jgi:hypothetical protein